MLGCGRKGLRLFSFARCFEEYSKGAEGAAGLLLVLSRCQLLQDVRSLLGLVGASSGFLPLFEVEPRGADDDSHYSQIKC